MPNSVKSCCATGSANTPAIWPFRCSRPQCGDFVYKRPKVCGERSELTLQDHLGGWQSSNLCFQNGSFFAQFTELCRKLLCNRFAQNRNNFPFQNRNLSGEELPFREAL
jgi:hypothetical protein